MSSFFVDLWESIFTPGPTPSILKAANASFAALQLVLLGLLIGTHSVHFIVLSVLCSGLWWSVNWFAAELKLAQQREAEQAAAAGASAGASGSERDGEAPVDDSSDTEVEGGTRSKGRPVGRKGRKAAAGVEVLEPAGELKRRGGGGGGGEEDSAGGDSQGGTQSSVSTEDEWEKVSESEKEKDK